MNVDPNFLALFGLCLNFVGSLLFGIDALGASEFLRELDSVNETPAHRMAVIGFKSAVNNVFVFLFVSLGGLVAFLIILPNNRIVLALLIAPLVFPAWKLAAYLEPIRKPG